jgi:hypothetical protein
VTEPPSDNTQRFTRIMKVIFQVSMDEIACEDCFNALDRYVEMLRSGKDAGEVLPQVKAHLGMCSGCDEEFRALIAILEAMDVTGSPDG